jgi:hypothetical protein
VKLRLSKILREAARLVEGDEHAHSCTAVSSVVYRALGGRAKRVDWIGRCVFGPERIAYQELLLGPDGRFHIHDFGFLYNSDAHNLRVLALCMAATLAEDAGL